MLIVSRMHTVVARNMPVMRLHTDLYNTLLWKFLHLNWIFLGFWRASTRTYAVGDTVQGMFGWRMHTISDGNPENHWLGLYKVDTSHDIGLSTAGNDRVSTVAAFFLSTYLARMHDWEYPMPHVNVPPSDSMSFFTIIVHHHFVHILLVIYFCILSLHMHVYYDTAIFLVDMCYHNSTF